MKQEKTRAKNTRDVSLELIPENRLPAERPYDENSECPSAEQAMLRQAARHLTSKQRQVWDLYNYDKLTQDEIGVKLGITHQGVAKHIKAIEKRVAKWCKSNMAAYNLIKQEMEKE